MAAARVKELAAMKRIDFANLFPQLNGSVYTQKEASNYGGDKYSNDPETGAKATVSWEVDLWGNLRWAKDKVWLTFGKHRGTACTEDEPDSRSRSGLLRTGGTR